MASPEGGKYQILELLHEDSQTAVYRVRHRILEEERTVETLRLRREADAPARDDLARAARAAIRLRQPNLARIYDYAFAADGTCLLVREPPAGPTLDVLLRSAPRVPLSVAVEIAVQTLAALEHLHARSLYGQLSSPGRVRLTRSPSGRLVVKVVHLGISQLHQLTGGPAEHPLYTAPELLGREASVPDARSDIFAWGAILYHVFTGQLPFPEKTTYRSRAGTSETVRPFSETDPSGRVPEAARACLLHALKVPREERPSEVRSLAAPLFRLRGPRAAAARELNGFPPPSLSPQRSETGHHAAAQRLLDEVFPLHRKRPRPLPENPEEAGAVAVEALRLLEAREWQASSEDPPLEPAAALAEIRRRIEEGELASAAALLERVEQRFPTASWNRERKLLGTIRSRRDALRSLLDRALELSERGHPSTASPLPEKLPRPSSSDTVSLSEEEVAELGPPTAPPAPIDPVTRRARRLAALEVRDLYADGEPHAAFDFLQRALAEHGASPELLKLRRDLTRALELRTEREAELIKRFGHLPWEAASTRRRRGRGFALGGLAAALVGFLLLASQPQLLNRVVTPAGAVQSAPGHLALDALPWGEIVSITNDQHQPVRLGTTRYTPVLVELPPGTYLVEVAHPAVSGLVVVRVQIRSGGTTLQRIRFPTLSPERFLEQLLD